MKRALLFIVLCISTSLAAQNGFRMNHSLELDRPGRLHVERPQKLHVQQLNTGIEYCNSNLYLAASIGIQRYAMKLNVTYTPIEALHMTATEHIHYEGYLYLATGGLKLGYCFKPKGNDRLEFIPNVQLQWEKSFYQNSTVNIYTYYSPISQQLTQKPALAYLKRKLGLHVLPAIELLFRIHASEQLALDLRAGIRNVITPNFGMWNTDFYDTHILYSCIGISYKIFSPKKSTTQTN